MTTIGGVLIPVIAAQAPGGTITVGLGGGYDHDNIQAAINAAGANDTVLVADGVYTGVGNRDIDFLGKAITVRSENGPANCVVDVGGTVVSPHRAFTFQSGEANASILDGLTIRNGYVKGAGGGISVLSSSPTIANCRITGNSAYYAGGGIYAENGAPLVRDSLIHGNNVIMITVDTIGGGGMALSDCQAVVERSRVVENASPRTGGGLWVNGGSVSVTDCSFVGNSVIGTYTGTAGGGGVALSGCQAAVERSRIVANESPQNGGGLMINEANVSVTDCLLAGNSATDSYYGDGGGVYTHDADGILTRNVLVGNRAGCAGGGIDLHETRQAFAANIVAANLAEQTGPWGAGGGARIHLSAGPFDGNVITGNKAVACGGGVAANTAQQDTLLTNNIVCGNVAGSEGGGIYRSSIGTGTLELVCSTVAHNHADGPGDGFSSQAFVIEVIVNSIFWGGAAQISTVNPVDATYSDIEGGYAGAGNIDADPLFAVRPPEVWSAGGLYDADGFQTVLTGGSWTPGELAGRLVNPDTTQPLQFFIVDNDATMMTVWGDASGLAGLGASFQVYDYRLDSGSPCVDAGCDAGVYRDIDGWPRPFDYPGVDNNGPLPEFDMGAYEDTPRPGDANVDDCVDGLDYTIWSNNYHLSGMTWEQGDFTGDGYVDGLDYVIWSNNYHLGCPAAPGAVPEPSSALLLALGFLALRRRLGA